MFVNKETSELIINLCGKEVPNKRLAEFLLFINLFRYLLSLSSFSLNNVSETTFFLIFFLNAARAGGTKVERLHINDTLF